MWPFTAAKTLPPIQTPAESAKEIREGTAVARAANEEAKRGLIYELNHMGLYMGGKVKRS